MTQESQYGNPSCAERVPEEGLSLSNVRPASILLVDDDERNLVALEAILDSPDYRLVRATSAEEALHALMSEHFALLVLDVRMPRVSGLELAQMIKERKKTRHVPIIFLSAYYQEDEHALQGYDAGAVDYITKPLNPFVLRSKVAAFVDLYRANRALQDEIAERRAAERRLAERTSEVQNLVEQLRALALELTRTEQRERRHLAKILHDHMQQLIASALMQLSSLTRLNGGVKTTKAVVDIEATLQEALMVSRSVTVELSPPVLHEAGLAAGLRWFAERLREKHQFNVIIRADGRAEPTNEEERFLLYECVRELLFNAVKHAGVSEAEVDVFDVYDGRIQIVVEDHGVGFDPKHLRFDLAGNATFGLFSVQQRLTHLGGALEIQSGPGEGTRITVTAPPPRVKTTVEGPEPARLPTEDVQAAPSADIAEEIRVLIVDDHKIVRQALASLLEWEKDVVVVGEAGTAPEAVERAKALRPDIIIMDVDLGETSGIQATKDILENEPGSRVVALSMHVESEVAAAMRKVGAVAYLTKDVAAEDLLTLIRDTYHGRHASPDRTK